MPDPVLLATASLAPVLLVDGTDVEPAVDQLRSLAESFIRSLPMIAIGLLVGAVVIVVGGWLVSGLRRGLSRTKADRVAVEVVGRVARVFVVVAAILLALAVAGVQVGPALAGLGIAGLAVALALQGILENFIAGIILMIRKPFRAGDQVATNDFEGTVVDLDLRVTRLVDYDGRLVLIPNTDVFRQPLVNLTRRGTRRTVVQIAVDYRDDHDAAREVVRAAVTGLEGVLDEPAPEVLLTELGDSGVVFDIRYWTLPDILTVRRTQDRVLSAAKRAVEGAGMTIPWPIRTLVVDSPVRVVRDDAPDAAGGEIGTR